MKNQSKGNWLTVTERKEIRNERTSKERAEEIKSTSFQLKCSKAILQIL